MAMPPSEFMKALAGALAGALGGYVSAFTLFPLDVLKTKQQSGSNSHGRRKFKVVNLSHFV